MTPRRIFRIVMLLVALGLAAHRAGWLDVGSRKTTHDPVVVNVPPEAIGRQSAPAPTSAPAEALVGRDLQQDESRGGHTIARHVGKTDEQLLARLARERRISAASTYTDLPTAQRVVAATLASERDRIDRWARRDGSRPNLALDYAGAPATPIGRSIAQGASSAEPVHDAVVVLRWDASSRDWYVLTSYPEARRGR